MSEDNFDVYGDERKGTEEKLVPLKLEDERLEDSLAEIASLQTPQQRKDYYKHHALKGKKRVCVETACILWSAFLGNSYSHTPEWCAFVQRQRGVQNGSITADEWVMFGEFSEQILDDFSNHNSNEAWPSLIDSFVESQRVKASYIGLRNQGATCYLNSLLQTLFITPEFRKALFGWKSKDKNEKDSESIPKQLQRLFGTMQLARGGCIGTESLTKSFGWGTTESFKQHDVLELLQVLVDALESVEISNSHQSGHLTSLMTGINCDSIKCNSCGNERSHNTPFINLSIDMTGNISSLNEAITKYLQSELLQGPNAVICPKCQVATPSTKSIRILSLPELLFLHLGRFTYDRSLQQRVKLNNVLKFPLFLDASKLCTFNNNNSHEEADQNATMLAAVLEQKAEALELEIAKNFQIAEESTNQDTKAYHRMVVDLLRSDLDLVSSRPNGNLPSLYELFSVLVHSGSAHGGHYYCIAKSFEQGGKWFNFNDSYVTEVACSSVFKTFGTVAEQGSSFGANAYMLVYRKVSHRNICTVENSEIPKEITEEYSRDAARSLGFVEHRTQEDSFDMAASDAGDEYCVDYEEFDDAQETVTTAATANSSSNLIEVNLFRMPSLDSPRETLHISKTDTFTSFFIAALSSIDPDCNPLNARLRVYNPDSHEVSQDCLFYDHSDSVGNVFKHNQSSLSSNLLVEFNTEGYPKSDDILISVSLVVEKGTPPISRKYLWISRTATVRNLQKLLVDQWKPFWRLSSTVPTMESIQILHLSSFDNNQQNSVTASTKLISQQQNEKMISCTIFVPGLMASSVHISEPSLKINKRK